ncbi:Alpha-1,3-mannosyltransferase-like protein [Dinochytrium kinnereticum]|nr:Alpha-1,3-mannosyltransferase-like protein [Dinochytrium kinnereticum]
MSKDQLNIHFVHPDLGIGGAERLVVDAAVGLQRLGHKVTIFTSHHDPKHCFEETANGTLDVKVYGDWLPRHIGGKFMIFFALLRNLYLSLCLMFLSIISPASSAASEVALVDQISLSIPILRLFYPRSWIKRLYRAPFDAVEEFTTGMADETLVNSEFTRGVFKGEFRSIKKRPTVLHPGIQTSIQSEDSTFGASIPSSALEPFAHTKFLLSVNRFERKKDISLAVKSFAKMLVNGTAGDLRLFLAGAKSLKGGYDNRVKENVEYHQELQALCDSFKLKHHTVSPFPLSKSAESENAGSPLEAKVVFLLSISNSDRTFLLSKAVCLLYTPSGEHFGIVPVEAMYSRTPVIAVNDGGPTETIVEGITGYLRDPNAEAFSEAVARIMSMPEAARQRMGDAGRQRVIDHFSLDSFSRRLDSILQTLPPRRLAAVMFVRGWLVLALLAGVSAATFLLM